MQKQDRVVHTMYPQLQGDVIDTEGHGCFEGKIRIHWNNGRIGWMNPKYLQPVNAQNTLLKP
jgi:hypothetical protein